MQDMDQILQTVDLCKYYGKGEYSAVAEPPNLLE